MVKLDRCSSSPSWLHLSTTTKATSYNTRILPLDLSISWLDYLLDNLCPQFQNQIFPAYMMSVNCVLSLAALFSYDFKFSGRSSSSLFIASAVYLMVCCIFLLSPWRIRQFQESCLLSSAFPGDRWYFNDLGFLSFWLSITSYEGKRGEHHRRKHGRITLPHFITIISHTSKLRVGSGLSSGWSTIIGSITTRCV